MQNSRPTVREIVVRPEGLAARHLCGGSGEAQPVHKDAREAQPPHVLPHPDHLAPAAHAVALRDAEDGKRKPGGVGADPVRKRLAGSSVVEQRGGLRNRSSPETAVLAGPEQLDGFVCQRAAFALHLLYQNI